MINQLALIRVQKSRYEASQVVLVPETRNGIWKYDDKQQEPLVTKRLP